MTTLDPLVQVRLALSDVDGAILATATAGAPVTYEELLAHYADDVAATTRAAAGILAGYFARQVSSVSASGKSVAWFQSRYDHYAAIAAGRGGGLAAAASPIIMVPVAGQPATDEYSR